MIILIFQTRFQIVLRKLSWFYLLGEITKNKMKCKSFIFKFKGNMLIQFFNDYFRLYNNIYIHSEIWTLQIIFYK